MRNKVRSILKNSRLVYSLYYYIFSFLLRFLGLFVKTDEDLVLFVEYSGRKYDDSPKVLYEYMKGNSDYYGYKTVWAFEKPEEYNLPVGEKIKIDSWKYYITALKAKYWITNSSITRGLNFKKKKTKYIIFQHGTAAIKVLGDDIKKGNKSFKIKSGDHPDMYIIQGKKEKGLIEKAFGHKGKIYELGLPRNDELYNATAERIQESRKKLGIPDGKKVIIYTPTFREFKKDSKIGSYIEFPFDIEKMRAAFSDEYVLVVTAHYEVEKMLKVPKNDKFVINAFNYPNINDILLAGDVMISDYSSVIFDYSILERPIFCFGYDYDEYMVERGTYANLEELFCDGVIKDQDTLIEKIKNMDFQKECMHAKKIKNEYLLNIKNSVSAAAQEIFKKEDKEKKNVLHVISTLKRGGTEKYMLDLLRGTKTQYNNYVLYYYGKNELENELGECGAKVIRLGKEKCGNIATMRSIQKIIKKNNIDTVYSYTFYNSAYVMLAAFLAGCKKRITHSHRVCYDEEKVNFLKLIFAKTVVSFFATDRLACNTAAGKGLYVNSFKVIDNGIDVGKYKYDENRRSVLRKEFGIKDDTVVLGSIGTLNNNKNQKFILDIVYELNRVRKKEVKAIIIGDGQNRKELEEYAQEKKIADDVLFLGEKRDVSEYYNVFDFFILPSKKEGLPYVLLEAQANGVPVISSTSVSKEAKINDNFAFLSLDDGAKKWAEEIVGAKALERTVPSQEMSRYSCANSVQKIIGIYNKKRITLPLVLFTLIMFIFPAIGLVCAALLYFKNNNKKETVLYSLLFGALIALCAYNFVPRPGFDLIRHQRKVELYSNVSTFDEFAEQYKKIDLEVIPQLYTFTISRFDNKDLLQFFVVLVGFSAVLYMLADYRRQKKIDNKYFIPIVVLGIFSQPIVYYFSGLYFYLATSIFALAFYIDYYNKNKIPACLLYALLPLIHIGMILPVGAIIMFKISRSKINIISVVLMLLIALFFVFNYGHFLIDNLGMSFLSPIQKIIDAYIANNSHFISQNYGGLGLVLGILETIMVIFWCIIDRKNSSNRSTRSFLILFTILLAILSTRIMVMTRFIAVILLGGLCVAMDIMQNDKAKMKKVVTMGVWGIALILCAYNVYAVLPCINPSIINCLFFTPVNLLIR